MRRWGDGQGKHLTGKEHDEFHRQTGAGVARATLTLLFSDGVGFRLRFASSTQLQVLRVAVRNQAGPRSPWHWAETTARSTCEMIPFPSFKDGPPHRERASFLVILMGTVSQI